MWDHDYRNKPIDILKMDGAEIMVNLSSSPFGIDKARVRDAYLARQSKGFNQFWYVNNIGRGGNGKNEHAFDGSSLLFADGKKQMQAPTFEEGIFDAEAGTAEAPTKGKEIFDVEVYVIRQGWESIGKPKIVIGLSGGIDSAISAALHVKAIGAENVIGVNMPTVFNGPELKDAALDLANKLGITYHVIPLGERITILKDQVENILQMPESLNGVPFENMQARDRSTSILAAVAAAYKGVYTCNGNKSEVFTGYATLDGDAR
jgi:NAD+ synthase (glutamine-hydrolysing)